MRRFYRSRDQRMIAGVCGGIGEYFGVDPTAIRLIWALFTLITGVLPGVLLYFIFWAVMPLEPVGIRP
ncbi:MAG: PspC domain-containing protein [Sphingomonadaceae bacterium]